MERRRNQRYPRNFALTGIDSSREVHTRMIARDLSLSGLSCTSDVCFDEMTRLALRLMLPLDPAAEPETIELEAVVVRHRPIPSNNGESRFELALFFTGIQADTRDKLRRYLGN